MGFQFVRAIDTGSSANIRGKVYNRRIILRADGPGETDATAEASPHVPAWGSGHPTYPFAALNSKEARREERSPRIWYVDLQYVTNRFVSTIDPEQEIANPLLDPSIRRFTFTQRQQSVLASPLSGVPILNSAGTIIPTDYEDVGFVLSITRNEIPESPSHYIQYNDTINDGAFIGSLPGELLLKITTGEEQNRSGLYYMTVTYEITALPRTHLHVMMTVPEDLCPVFNSDGTFIGGDVETPTHGPVDGYVSAFDRIVLQQGFYYRKRLSGGAYKMTRFTDSSGEPTVEPELLNVVTGDRLVSRGKKLGDPGEPEHANYMAYKGKRRSNFNDLNLLST